LLRGEVGALEEERRVFGKVVDVAKAALDKIISIIGSKSREATHLKDEDSFFDHVDGSVLATRISVNPLEPFWIENRRDL
jgi:hypothetical protein